MKSGGDGDEGWLYDSGHPSHHWGSHSGQAKECWTCDCWSCSSGLYSLLSWIRTTRLDLPRLMSGTHPLPLAEEWIAAISPPHQNTLQAPGVIPTSRWRDLPAPVLQFISWVTWRILWTELPVVPLYQRRWSCDAFASVKAGVLHLFISLARGLQVQDSRYIEAKFYRLILQHFFHWYQQAGVFINLVFFL